MMIKKVEKNLGGGQMGQYPNCWVFLMFKLLFWQSVFTNPTKVAENVYLGVLQHPIKFQAKILTGKILFVKKLKNSSSWQSYFLGLFLAITPHPLC